MSIKRSRRSFLCATTVLAACAPLFATAATNDAESDYLKRKWRENLADMTTGKDAVTLKAEIAAKAGEWVKTGDFATVKARAFAYLCENTAIDVSPHDWFPTFAFWTRHTLKTHPVLELVQRHKNEVMKDSPALRRVWPKHMTGYPDFDHSAPDWDDILALGFTGMEQRLRDNWKEGPYYPPRFAAIKAVMKLLDRLVVQGEKNAEADSRDTRIAKTVASLKRLRSGPPVTALDALEFFSLATANSVKTGRDAYSGGMLHGNNTGIWLIGLGSTVDALMAVKEFAFDHAARRSASTSVGAALRDARLFENAVSLREFGKILADDWQGNEELRRRILRSKSKWGNNDPATNAAGRELVKRLGAVINGRKNSRGGQFKAFGHVARWNYSMGARLGATPDGRKAGDEISKNISPTMGADTEGVTALIDTIANIEGRDLPGDMPLDVALLPNTVAGERGRALMRALVNRYFKNGGLVIQFNIHDPAVLRDAQAHPEKYENLQVRVAGWNVRWNDIPKQEQDAFILRQERIVQ